MRLATPAQRDPVGGHLQRADHHRPDPAGAARRDVSSRSAPRSCCGDNLLIYGLGGLIVPFIGIKLIDLLLVAALRPGIERMLIMRSAQFRPALVIAARRSRSSPAWSIPLVVTGVAQARLPRPGRRQPDRQRRQGRRLATDRPAVRRPEVLLVPAVGDDARALQRRGVAAARTSGPTNPALIDAVERAHRRAARRRPGERDSRSRSIWSPPPPAASIRTSAWPPADYQVARVARRARASPSTRASSWSTQSPRAARSASSASRG